MIKQTPRIILTGDEEEASYRAREGIRQLEILKNLMRFGKLEQDVRRVRYIDGSEIICRSIFGIDDIQIYIPREDRWKWTKIIVPRFFAKVKTGEYYDEFFKLHIATVSYYWIYFGKVEDVISMRVKESYIQSPPDKYNTNIVAVKISDSFERTEEEVEMGFGFHFTLEQALTPFIQANVLDTPCFATKAFMLEDDHAKDEEEEEEYIKERWITTTHYLFKDRYAKMNVRPKWTPPIPCDDEELPCPPTRFYCDIDKKILVWYGDYEIFVGALIIRFDDLNIEEERYIYTWNSVAATGASISGDRGYETLPDTEWDIPLNMISGLNWVDANEISFYLPYGANRRPGQVTIDWIDYMWGVSVSAEVIDHVDHWYWSEDGFERKACASLDQTILDGSIEDKYEEYSVAGNDCSLITDPGECNGTSVIQTRGIYSRDVGHINGYKSLYQIDIFDDTLKADTTFRNSLIEERKHYNAGKCKWIDWASQCIDCGLPVFQCAIRNIREQLTQKKADGLSAYWLSNNIAYYYKEKNREKCSAYANQSGWQKKVFGVTNVYIYWGGPAQLDFASCMWHVGGSPWCILWNECPDGLGMCFELDMPGEDWFYTDEDNVDLTGSDSHGDRYEWTKNTDRDSYNEPPERKFKADETIEFDATEIYKTYYLDDRATEDSQGMIVAGKGVRDECIYWEVYHEYIDEDNITKKVDITEELFKQLNCTQQQLVEIGLI